MKIRNMNNKGSVSIVLVIAGLLLIGVAGAYFATDGFGTQEQSQQQTTSTEQQENEASESTSPSSPIQTMKSALSGGSAVECSYVVSGYKSNIYMAQSGDTVNFNAVGQSDEGKVHLIKNGNTVYMWQDGSSEGLTFSGKAYDENYKEKYGNFDPESIEQKANEGSISNVECSRTNKDKSKLETPSNVTFQSVSDMMQSIPNQQ